MSKQRASLFIGRFQPLHAGHIALIRTVLDEGKPVVVEMMDTEIDEANPYTVAERMKMFIDEFGTSVSVRVREPVGEVCYGRNVGYRIRRIHLPAGLEAISATSIREGKHG